MDGQEKIEETDKMEDTKKADKLEGEASADKAAASSGLSAPEVERIIDAKLNIFMDKLSQHYEKEEDQAVEKSLNTKW